MFTVEIYQGLPGSGKTHMAKQQTDRRTYVAHLDDFRVKDPNLNDMKSLLMRAIPSSVSCHYDRLILDGLFLTNQDIANAILCVVQFIPGGFDVVIHHWNENREVCMKNDVGRRDKNAHLTIMTAKYEKPCLELLNAAISACAVFFTINIKDVVFHDVELAPGWVRCFMPRVNIKANNGELASAAWTAASCCNNHMLDGEQPYEFDELDALLDQVAPALSYKDYRTIKRACVSTRSDEIDDYYNTVNTMMWWVCDLKILYEKLKELGYIEE